jgi:NAD(P)-dependent dehydrogenase (short-subunit alcohol dehydrogenase family)
MVEPGTLLSVANELAAGASDNRGRAVAAVLAAHGALEAFVNRVGGEEIASFNYRARFLPKWHDLCERTLGRQLEAAPDLERLQALRDTALGFQGELERLDRRSATPPPEIPAEVGAGEARWSVETARRVIAEFHAGAGRELPGWL